MLISRCHLSHGTKFRVQKLTTFSFRPLQRRCIVRHILYMVKENEKYVIIWFLKNNISILSYSYQYVMQYCQVEPPSSQIIMKVINKSIKQKLDSLTYERLNMSVSTWTVKFYFLGLPYAKMSENTHIQNLVPNA